ncbi:hypothetical protein KIPB_012775, partial [Kipferlia bialata]|eukprot:g12775.t1
MSHEALSILTFLLPTTTSFSVATMDTPYANPYTLNTDESDMNGSMELRIASLERQVEQTKRDKEATDARCQ